jgi:hypothetical protein
MLQTEIDFKDLSKKVFLKIEDLELSVRSKNCLRSCHIVYVGDLLQRTDNDLLSIRNFGRTCLREVKRLLRTFDLELGIKIPEWKTLPPKELIEKFHQYETFKYLHLQSAHEDNLIKPDKETLIKFLRRVDELDLSVRAANCLKELKVLYIGDLVLKRRSELLKLHNLGRKSINEIEDKLSNMRLQLGLKIADWPPKNIREMLKIFDKELEQARRRESEKLVKDLGIETLEDELNNLAKMAGSERNSRIITKYFGWDGKGTRSLEKVGLEFGMTRERVRQIRDKFENKFKRAKFGKARYSPFLEQAFKFISDRLPCLAEEIEKEFVDHSITKVIFNLDGILAAANILRHKVPFSTVTMKGKRIVVQSESIKVPKIILRLAKKAIEHWGAATISDITEQAQEESKQQITDDFTIMILSLVRRDFNWLDEAKGWFWLHSVPRNRLVNLLQKILAVTNQINISDLRTGIGRVSRMEGFAPPRRVLIELCHQIPWCKVEGSIIKADPPLDWENVLAGTTEWAMAAVLKEFGPVMSRDEFEEKCLGLGMNLNTFQQFLSYSSIIAKFDVGVYGLRGAIIPPGIIEAIRPQARIGRVLKDFGWTSDGKIWLAHRISKGMINSGVFGVPAAMRQFIQGNFNLKTADGIIIGQLKVKDSSGWSLGRLFQRRGGEPGDYLMLIFDSALRQVEARIGDEGLFDDFLPSD